MCSVLWNSSLNSSVCQRNLDGYPKTLCLYDASLAQNIKCQAMAAYPKYIHPGEILSPVMYNILSQ